MTLADCAPGDKVRIPLRAFHPATVEHLELADETYVVQVAEPLATGVGVNILDEFTLTASDFAPAADGQPRYAFTVVDLAGPVLEVVERTKYPRGKRDKGEGRTEDVIDPLRRRGDELV